MATRAFTATTTIRQMTPFSVSRIGVTVINAGASACFVSQDAISVTSQGFYLPPSGFITYLAVEGDDPRLALYVQMLAGTTDLRISESFSKPEIIKRILAGERL